MPFSPLFKKNFKSPLLDTNTFDELKELSFGILSLQQKSGHLRRTILKGFWSVLHVSKISLQGVILGLILSACSVNEDKYEDKPVNDLYTDARKFLEAGEYTKAAKAFAEVETQHPYSNWALKAQIMSAYCYYMAKKYDESIDGFKTFIQLHPGHQDVAYAYYMIGLNYYEQIPIVSRDQEPAEKAEEAFKEVMNRFKTSIYAKDASLRIDFLRDHMAAKEMDIARFYASKKSLVAALNRFKVVIEKYHSTSQAPEAMYRLVECYLTLGLKEEALATAAVLGHNYPAHSWYKAAYELLKKPLKLVKPRGQTAEEKEQADKLEKQEDSLFKPNPTSGKISKVAAPTEVEETLKTNEKLSKSN